MKSPVYCKQWCVTYRYKHIHTPPVTFSLGFTPCIPPLWWKRQASERSQKGWSHLEQPFSRQLIRSLPLFTHRFLAEPLSTDQFVALLVTRKTSPSNFSEQYTLQKGELQFLKLILCISAERRNESKDESQIRNYFNSRSVDWTYLALSYPQVGNTWQLRSGHSSNFGLPAEKRY